MGPQCSIQSSRYQYHPHFRLCSPSRNPYAFYLQVRYSDVDIFGRQPGFFPGRNARLTHDWDTVGHSYTLALGGVLAKSVNEVIFIATRYITDDEGAVEEVGILRVPVYLSPDSWDGSTHADPLELDILPGDLSRWGVTDPVVGGGQIRVLFPDHHPTAVGYILDHFDLCRSFVPRNLVASTLDDPTYTHVS